MVIPNFPKRGWDRHFPVSQKKGRRKMSLRGEGYWSLLQCRCSEGTGSQKDGYKVSCKLGHCAIHRSWWEGLWARRMGAPRSTPCWPEPVLMAPVGWKPGSFYLGKGSGCLPNCFLGFVHGPKIPRVSQHGSGLPANAWRSAHQV